MLLGQTIGLLEMESEKLLSRIEQLEEELKYINLLFNAFDSPIYVIDAKDYTVKRANARTGIDIKSVNDKCHCITHNNAKPCKDSEHPCPLEIVKRTKKAAVVEHMHKDKNGNEVNVEVHGHPVFDSDGNVIEMIEYTIDISKRKNAQKIQTILYNVSEAATSTKDINSLYKKVHDFLSEIINVDNFYIAIADNIEKMLSFPFFVDSHDAPPPPQPLGKGLTEYVLNTGKAVLLNKNEILNLNKLGKINIVGSIGEQWMGVPLIRDSQVLGVIAMNSYKDPDRYNTEDLKVMSFVSEQIARAIEYKLINEEKEVERLYLEELFRS